MWNKKDNRKLYNRHHRHIIDISVKLHKSLTIRIIKTTADIADITDITVLRKGSDPDPEISSLKRPNPKRQVPVHITDGQWEVVGGFVKGCGENRDDVLGWVGLWHAMVTTGMKFGVGGF